MKTTVFISALLLLATACSTYVYKEEVGSFSKAVNDVDSALQSSLDEIQDVYTQSCHRTLRQRPTYPTIRLSEGCTYKGNGTCTLEIPDEPACDQGVLINFDNKSKALKSYASALEAMVSSDDREALTKAQSDFVATCSTFQSLLSFSSCDEFNAVSNVFNSSIILGLDRQRLMALKRAVVASHDSVSVLARVYEQDFPIVHDEQVSRLRRDINLRLRDVRRLRLSQEQHDEVLQGIQADIDKINRINKFSAKALSDNMINAHKALLDAVQSNDRQLGELSKAIEQFKDSADALLDIYNQD